VVIKRFLPMTGQFSIFNFSGVFCGDGSANKTSPDATRQLSNEARAGISTARHAREPAIRGWQTAVIASEAKQSAVPHTTAMDCFVTDAPRNDGASVQ
jgi:hypothetical protein